MADSVFHALMEGVADLPHGDLKQFATRVRSQLTGRPNPCDADFCDAIYEAAKALARGQDTGPFVGEIDQHGRSVIRPTEKIVSGRVAKG